jgi:hypothetical protein
VNASVPDLKIEPPTESPHVATFVLLTDLTNMRNNMHMAEMEVDLYLSYLKGNALALTLELENSIIIAAGGEKGLGPNVEAQKRAILFATHVHMQSVDNSAELIGLQGRLLRACKDFVEQFQWCHDLLERDAKHAFDLFSIYMEAMKQGILSIPRYMADEMMNDLQEMFNGHSALYESSRGAYNVRVEQIERMHHEAVAAQSKPTPTSADEFSAPTSGEEDTNVS